MHLSLWSLCGETGRWGKAILSCNFTFPLQPQRTGLLHVAAKDYWELKRALELQNKAHYKWHRNTTGNGEHSGGIPGFLNQVLGKKSQPRCSQQQNTFQHYETKNSPNMCYLFFFFSSLSAFFIYDFMYSVGFIVIWPFALLGVAVSPKQNPSSIMVKTEVNSWTHKGWTGSKLNRNKKTVQFKLLSSYIHHFWFYSLGNYTCRFNHVQKHLPGWDWSHNL